MQYRTEIDGLRALAVVPVILFHAGFHQFSGGFVGVDIFFVISGYLITSIIVQEKMQGSFSIVNFYERRARRILPALFAVVLVCLPVAWWIMLPHQLHDFGQSIVATSLFLSNFFFYLETDYFNDFADTAPLLHTWSLAVEEQYYILFPIIVSLVFMVSRRWLGPIMLTIALASIMLAEQWLSSNAAAAFYLLPARAWELMLGGLIGILPHYPRLSAILSNPKARLQNELGSALGLAMILGAIFLLDEQTRFPGLGAVLPVVGTCLIILFAGHQTWVQRLLSLKPLVWIGLLSYSLYLWHQPILAFFRLEYRADPNLAQVTVLLALIVMLSWVSWKYIEAPFRNRQAISRTHIFAYSIAGMTAFVAVGLVSHEKQGFLDYTLSKYEDTRDFELIDREANIATRKQFLRQKIDWNNTAYVSNDERRVLILGDSLSADLFITFALNEDLSERYETKRKKLDDPCMRDFVAVLSKQVEVASLNTACQRDIKPILRDGLVEQADHILITANWQFDTYEAGAELARFLKDKYDVKVSVMGNAMFQDMVSLSFEMLEDGMDKQARRRYVYENIRHDRMGDSTRLKELVEADPEIEFIDKMPFFCNRSDQTCDLFAANGDAYVFDNVHLTMAGARAFGRWVAPRLDL